MTHSARDARERGWIWLLRGVGVLLALVVVANVVDVGSHLWSAVTATADSAPAIVQATADADKSYPPGAYHVECAEFRPTMSARLGHAVQQMLPARLIASEAELPPCQRCGDRIERGSQIWLASTQ